MYACIILVFFLGNSIIYALLDNEKELHKQFFQTEDKVPKGALFLWKKGGRCGIIGVGKGRVKK